MMRNRLMEGEKRTQTALGIVKKRDYKRRSDFDCTGSIHETVKYFFDNK